MAIAAHLAKRAPARGDEESEITSEDADVVALFFALHTQWRWHPVVGVRMGIDYSSIAPTAAASGLRFDPGVFADIRHMEAAALGAFVHH